MMKITKLMVILIGVTLGFSGCDTLKNKYVSINHSLKKKMADSAARLVIIVNNKGDFVFVDKDGRGLEPCTVGPNEDVDQRGGSEQRTKSNQLGKLRQCRSFQKGGRLLKMKPLVITKGEGSFCLGGGPTVTGGRVQNCWFDLKLNITNARAEIHPGSDNDIAIIVGNFSLDPGSALGPPSDKIEISAPPKYINEKIRASFDGRPVPVEEIIARSLRETPSGSNSFLYNAPATVLPGYIKQVVIKYVAGTNNGEVSVQWQGLNLSHSRLVSEMTPFSLDIRNDLGVTNLTTFNTELQFYDNGITGSVHRYCIKVSGGFRC